jgi:hypothetical protein
MTVMAQRVRAWEFPPSSGVGAGPAAYWGPCLLVLACLAWPVGLALGYRMALGVLTVAGFVGAVAGISRPALGLLGIGLLCTVDAPARFLLLSGGLWRWNTLNYWLLIVLVCCAPLVLRLRDVHTRLAELLFVVMAIGLAISPDLEFGILHMLGLLSVLGLTVYFVRARDEDSALYWLGLVCGTTSALGSVAFLLQKTSLPYINPNAFAHFPVTGIFAICLGFSRATTRRYGQVVLSVLAGANLACVFLTGSRGTMLTSLACVLFLVTTFQGLGRRLLAVLVAAWLAVAISTLFTNLAAVAEHRIDKMLSPGYTLAARTNGRSELARASVVLFEQHPLGIGTGGFAYYYSDVSETPGFTTFGQGKEVQAHSAWTKTLAENGLPGFLVLAGYILAFGVVALRRRDRWQRALGVLASAAVGISFVSSEFQNKGVWLFAAGVTTLLQYPVLLPGRRDGL